MASSSSTTNERRRVLIDHDEIRAWAEARGAKPATVSATLTDEEVGIIRLDFPGYTGAGSLETIEWDEWFAKFDESGLALIVEETTAAGENSNFNKLVRRESVEDEIEGGPSRARTRPKKRGGRAARS